MDKLAKKILATWKRQDKKAYEALKALFIRHGLIGGDYDGENNLDLDNNDPSPSPPTGTKP